MMWPWTQPAQERPSIAAYRKVGEATDQLRSVVANVREALNPKEGTDGR